MAATLTLHINDGIPDDLMRLFFSNTIGHKLARPFTFGLTYEERDRLWKLCCKKYDLKPREGCPEDLFDIWIYFSNTPSYEIGDWSTLKAALSGNKKYLGEYYGHGDFSLFTHIIDDVDQDGFGAIINEDLISKMGEAAVKVWGREEDAADLIEFLQQYIGKKVFIISW